MSVARKHDLARDALARRDYDEAVRHIDEALQQNEHDATAMSLMSDLLEEQGEHMEAIGYAVLAINTDNASLPAKKKFLRLAGDMHFAYHNPNVESAILACLQTPDLEFGGANVLWGNALLANPAFLGLFQHVMRKRILPWSKPFDGITDFSPLLTDYFLLGISRIVVSFQPFEQFIVNLRAFLLEQSGDKNPRLPANDLLRLTCGMARYAFHADFNLATREKEAKEIDKYKRKAVDVTAAAQEVAILGCYQPLYGLPNADALQQKFADGETAEMVATHLTGNKRLQKRAAILPAPADNAAGQEQTC